MWILSAPAFAPLHVSRAHFSDLSFRCRFVSVKHAIDESAERRLRVTTVRVIEKEPGPHQCPVRQDGLELSARNRFVAMNKDDSLDGGEILLTFQEFELLAFLAAHPGTVFTRAELVERVWHRTLAPDGRPVARDSRTVDVHVSRVRRKLGPHHGRCLVTEYRVGYQYRP